MIEGGIDLIIYHNLSLTVIFSSKNSIPLLTLDFPVCGLQLSACREQQMIREGSGGGSGRGSLSTHEDELTPEKALKQARVRSKQHETKLFRFHDNLEDLKKEDKKTTQGQGLGASSNIIIH